MFHRILISFAAALSLSQAQTYSDNLLPNAARASGKTLGQSDLTEGGVKWNAIKTVTVGENGATSSAPAGAHFAIPVIAGKIRIEADISAKGGGFTSLALGRGNLSGDFWNNLGIMLTVMDGKYGIFAANKEIIPNADKSLMHPGVNHFEFTVDTVKRTAMVKVNGKIAAENVPLPEGTRLNKIASVGFRFNEPITGSPSISNYKVELASMAVAGLEPVDYSMSFVPPDQKSTLSWRPASKGPSKEVPYVINDFNGVKIDEGKAVLGDDGIVTLARDFPRGYAEIVFPEAGQTFGVVALEPHEGAADPFFSIDAGISWLEMDAVKRAGLVKIAARSGISMARERLGLGNITGGTGNYNYDTPRAFDAMRKLYADNNMSILEILDGGKSIGTSNFPQLAATISEVAKHWKVWGGAEVANEPDLKPVPADQYVPLAKAISYGLTDSQMPAPMVSGAFATIPPGPYFDTCEANGLLEESNIVSFHSYDKAPSIEGMVARYRTWLKHGGKEAMPLWHTECGWPWVNGPARPPQDQDAISGTEISAKASESMACGVGRYFPFVYVYYEEGLKNFGMMGREVTPLRSMAAYANCSRMLSHKTYLGDLTGLDASVKTARVFGDAADKECVAVLYTGVLDPKAKISFPIKIKSACASDGRVVEVKDQSLPITDGIVYVTMDAADAKAAVKADTSAKKLYDLGKNPLVQKRRASPIILQFLSEQTAAKASARRYLISQETAKQFPLNVRIHNLSKEPIGFTPELLLPGKAAEKSAAVTVPAMGFVDVSWKLDVTSSLDIARTKLISVTGKSESGIQPLPVAIPIVMEGDLEQHLKSHKNQNPLPIADIAKWQKNIAGHGTSTFSATPEGGWKMDMKFSGGAGNWTYPKMPLPAKIDPNLYSGFLVRGRIMKKADPAAMIVSTPGSPSFWLPDLFPADGEWHVVYAPFAEFKPGPGGAGNQNTRLDPAAWDTISIGTGSRSAENTMEISHLVLVGGGGE